MQTLNEQLFAWINAASHPPAGLLILGRIAAQDLIALVPLLLMAGWLWRLHAPRAALVSAGLAALAGLAINQIVGLLWFEPRPFALGVGHQFLAHAPDSAFPSDHLTVIWSAAFALCASRGWRGAGVGLALLGLPVAWARVYLGVHWPLDMAGAAVVSLASALLLLWAGQAPVNHLTALLQRAYEIVGRPLIARRWIRA